MMGLADRLLDQRRLVLMLALVLAALGVLAALTMPRQEDPSFPARNGQLVVLYPGADALTVERLVVRPLEEHLAEVPEIGEVNAVARADVAIVSLELSDAVYDTDPVWDDVQEKINAAAADFPDGVQPGTLNRELSDLEAMVVVLSGPTDPLVLRQAAEDLRDHLVSLRSVRRVSRIADPGEQVTVLLEPAVSRRVGLPPSLLAQRIAAQTAAIPGGVLHEGGSRVVVDPRNEVDSAAQLAALPVAVGGGGEGSSVPLGSLAAVRYGPVEPATDHLRLNGQPAVALGVVPRPSIDVVRFGEEVRAALAAHAPENVQVEILTDQPRRVSARLQELGLSLLQGVAIVAGVLVVSMGLRLGGVVALIVPLVTAISLALYAAAGGVLHQISIAGLVLSLGLLVDNGIVIAERVQYRVDRGQDATAAARDTIAELTGPLLSATGTTVASFIPLLLSQGGPGDFTRAIPQLVILTLCVSFGVAVTVTPTLAAMLFRASRATPPETPGWLVRLSRLPAEQPGRIALVTGAMVAASLALAPLVPQQFFPGSDRDQLVVELTLPEGTHLDETAAVAAVVEQALLARPEVERVAAFLGRSTPRFYYNLPLRPLAPHLAQLLVDTRTSGDVAVLAEAVRTLAREALPGVTVVARPLEQGPPLAAPVELRLYGEDLDAMWEVAAGIHGLLRQTPGATDVRHDLSAGTPAVSVQPVDAALARHGLTRQDLSIALLEQTRGLSAGWIRAGADPVPIRVRGPAGEETPLEQLRAVEVWSPQHGPIPLTALATVQLELRPPTLTRRNGERVTTISAQLVEGTTYGEVLAAVVPQAEALAAARGLRLERGGEAEGSGEANTAIFVAAPIGGAMLLGFLLAQFRSFRKVGIVLLTVPLAACGVVPGLLLAGQPFGFTSLLGVFALIGIVVNNAIILIDFIDTARQDEGASVEEAAALAVQVRLRPILLTTATTIAGLLPLLFSSSTLWPPLASALISGLAASTVLTLLAVPAAYILLFSETPRLRGMPPLATATATATALLLALVLSPRVGQAASLEEVWQAAEAHSPDLALAEVARAQAEARVIQARAAFTPKLVAQGGWTYNQEEIVFDPGASLGDLDLLMPSDLEPLFAAFHDPTQVEAVFAQVRAEEAANPVSIEIDPIVVRAKSYLDGSVVLSQPVLDLPAVPRLRAASAAEEAAGWEAQAARQQLRAAVARLYYGVAVADAAVEIAEQRIDNAAAHQRLAQERLAAGTAARIVGVQAELEVAEARRRLAEAHATQTAARQALARVTGLPSTVEVVFPEEEVVGLSGAGGTVEGRPDVQAAAARVAAAERMARSAALGGLPTVQARWTGTWTENPGFQPEQTYWFVGVQASWVLSDGGARRGARLEASAAAQAARLMQQQRVSIAEEEWAVAQARLSQAEEGLGARAQEQALAQEALRLAEAAFAAGQGAFLEVRDARLRAEEARLGVWVGQMERDLAAVEMLRVKGVL